MAADLTPEQYEMLFGEPPPQATTPGSLTFSEVTPVQSAFPKRTRRLAGRIREHPIDAAVIGLLLVGALVGILVR